MTDVLYAFGYGTLKQVLDVQKRANKFAKLGFYVLAEELGRLGHAELKTAIKNYNPDRPEEDNPSDYFLAEIERLSKGIKKSATGRVFSHTKEQKIALIEGGQIWHIALWGPADLKTDARPAPVEKVEKVETRVHLYHQTTVEEARQYIVVQQSSIGGEPTTSVPMTLEKAVQTAESASGVISSVYQLLTVVDNRYSEQQRLMRELMDLTSHAAEDPQLMGNKPFTDTMKLIISKMEKLSAN